MTLTIAAVLLGLGLGAALGGAPGAALGAVCGMALGLAWFSVQRRTRRVWPGENVDHERVRITCIPKGAPAECVFLVSKRTGKWVDVESCSLAPDEHDVRCPKNCLRQMNEAGALAHAAP